MLPKKQLAGLLAKLIQKLTPNHLVAVIAMALFAFVYVCRINVAYAERLHGELIELAHDVLIHDAE